MLNILLMLKIMKENKKEEGKTFMNFSYREVSKALKNYLGITDNSYVIFLFINKKALMVLYQNQWIKIEYDQLKMFL